MTTVARAPTAAHGATPFRASLGLPDFTLLVIGAVIGDGIYVVGATGARFLGPAQIVAWLGAGVLAAFIAVAFVQCAAIDPDVGGSYAYARTAFGPLIGFLAGWALYIGEWVALSVFPIAFTNYFQSLVAPLPGAAIFALRLSLIAAVTLVNLVGIKQGARTNDALTLAKLLPLALLMLLAVAFVFIQPSQAQAHVSPFAPLGLGGFGHAVLPIFWAYAGFELAVLPSAEVKSPQRTLPLGLAIGMLVATVFYLLTSLTVVVGVHWSDAAASSHPLALVMGHMAGAIGLPEQVGSRLMSAGALISIAGVFLVYMLSLARLSYALAVDGLFPSAFGKLHPRFNTPYLGLLFQAGSAVVLTSFVDLGGLITAAVFFLSFCYLLTALSALRLSQRRPELALHIPALKLALCLAAASSVYLALQGSRSQMLIGVGVLLLGLLVYECRRRTGSASPVNFVHGPQALEQHLHAWLLRSVLRRS